MKVGKWAVAAVSVGVLGCSKLVDKTVNTPTNKEAHLPYVKTPDGEFATGQSKATGPASTTYCAPDADGKYVFDTKMSSGETTDGANGHYHFAEGGGCLDRPIREAWAASMNQDLMVWTEPGNSGHYAVAAPPPGVTRFFDVEYQHVQTGIKVKWNMTWYHTILAGTPAAPEKILINYRRYKGTKFIKYWEGSIILTKLSDTVTGIWVRNQIRAVSVGEVRARGGATDIVSKIRSGSHDLGFLP